MCVIFLSDEATRQYTIRLLGLFRSLGFDREKVKDLAQETMTKAYQYRYAYNNSKCSNPWNWLSIIAVNIACDDWEKSKKKPIILIGEKDWEKYSLVLSDRNFKTSEQIAIIQEEQKLLSECLNELSDRCRNIIRFTYWSELSYKEIAIILDMSEKAVKTMAWRARGDLKDCLRRKNYGM